MNFIKKYYPMLITFIFMAMYSYVFANIFAPSSAMKDDSPFMIIFAILTILSVIGIWAEIIGFIIHAVKNGDQNNKIIWPFLIYFFNVFIVPYYNLKYVVKEKNIKTKMIVYIVLLSLITIGSASLAIIQHNYEMNKSQIVYVDSNDGYIQFELQGGFTVTDDYEYDLYAIDDVDAIFVGAYVYEKEKFAATEIQAHHIDWLIETRNYVYKITNFSNELNDKKIVSETFYGEINNDVYVYQISTIEFKDSNNIVNVIQVCFEEDYNKYRDEFKEILFDIKNVKQKI